MTAELGAKDSSRKQPSPDQPSEDSVRAYRKTDPENKTKLDIIVLMAGKGKRLLPLTEDRPKSLLLCEDNMSIFEHIVRSFVSDRLEPTVIPVMGHGYSKVYAELERLASLARYVPVVNPFYASAGPLVSLWLGVAHSKNEQTVILNGDTLIRRALVEKLLRWLLSAAFADRPALGVSVSPAAQFHADDMKILLDEKGAFRRAGKEIVPGKRVVKSAGVIAVKCLAGKKVLKRKLDQLLMDGAALDSRFFWHNILNEVKELFQISAIEVDPESWYEVDTNSDLNSINQV